MIKVKENLKIGLFGTRAKYIETAIKEFKFQYQILDDISKIDNTFNLALGSGVYDILKKEILDIPKYGIYGIHESLLPEGKGHAPIHWTILSGKKILTFTLFKIFGIFFERGSLSKFTFEIAMPNPLLGSSWGTKT